MSTYEQQRNENVRDNKQFLANLGLLNVGVLYRVQNNSHVNIFIHLFVLPHLISVLAQFFDSQQEMEEPKKADATCAPSALRKGCLVAVAGTNTKTTVTEMWLGKVLKHVRAGEAAINVRWLEKDEQTQTWIELDCETVAFRDSVIDTVACTRHKRGKHSHFTIDEDLLASLAQRLNEFSVTANRPVPVNLFSPSTSPESATQWYLPAPPSSVHASTVLEKETPRKACARPATNYNLTDVLLALKPLAIKAS
jgi:hypothetical protein